MQPWQMWTAIVGLPLGLIAEKGGCGARQPEFFGKKNQSLHADTHPYTRPHLRWGSWLLKNISIETEDYYG